jgi:predicted amino acid racemase
MFLRTPRLEMYVDRIAGNARTIIEDCARHHVQVAAVTKVLGAHPALIRALEAAGTGMIADSRISNLQSIADTGLDVPTMLLRIPSPSTVSDVVRCATYSLNSSVETVTRLSQAARLVGMPHKVIMMVDVGDLREGLWPERVVDAVKQVAGLPYIEVAGLGTNLACYGGIQPTQENMALLVTLRDECRAATGLPLDLISGGNSANLALMADGQMPPQINHLRIGEAICLGRNTADRTPVPGTRQDTTRIVAEVIELERKPSVPVGRTGEDAFGQRPTFLDRGVRLRAICNLGRQDVRAEDLTPEDPGILVIGASSDHLIIDVEDATTPIRLGTEVGFLPSYGGLLAATTSRYVQKVALRGGAEPSPRSRAAMSTARS